MSKRTTGGTRKKRRRSALKALPEVPPSGYLPTLPTEAQLSEQSKTRQRREAACTQVATEHGMPEPARFGEKAAELCFWIEADRYFATSGNFPSASAKKLFSGLADRATDLQQALDLVCKRPNDGAGALVIAARQVDQLNAIPETHGYPYQHQPLDIQRLRWELGRLAQSGAIAASSVKKSVAGTKGNAGITNFLILLREEFVRQRGEYGSRLTKDPYNGGWSGAFFGLALDILKVLNLRMSNGAHYSDSALAAAIERALKKADRNRVRGVSLIT